MIIIKDDLIGNSWGEHEHFCPTRKVFSTHFRFIFQNGDYERFSDREVVEVSAFIQKSFDFNTIGLIGQ